MCRRLCMTHFMALQVSDEKGREKMHLKKNILGGVSGIEVDVIRGVHPGNDPRATPYTGHGGYLGSAGGGGGRVTGQGQVQRRGGCSRGWRG